MMFTQEQVIGALRIILAAVLPTLVAHGYIDQSVAADLTSGAVAIVMLSWSVYDHRQAAKVKAGLAAINEHPDIKKIIAVAVPKDPLIKAAVADPGQPKISIDIGSQFAPGAGTTKP